MTVQEAVTKAREIKPSALEDEMLVGWLSVLDGQIFNDYISWHEGAGEPPEPYTVEDMSAVLLVPYPYSEDVYVPYLTGRINARFSELPRANNDLAASKAALSSFAAWYNRTHLSKDHQITGLKPL